MAVSRESMRDDKQLVRYLLGLLPEPEAEQLDEASIADDEVAARLHAVEDDLVDAYVTGTLDRETRDRFESFYLASPRRRAKVEFAKRFLAAVDRVPRARIAPSASAAPVANRVRRFARPPDADASRPPKFSWPMLTAVAGLVLACGVLSVEDVQLRRGLSDAERQRVAQDGHVQSLALQLDDARAAHAETARALDRARQSLATRGSQSAVEAPPQAVGAVSIVLFPQTRSLGPSPTVVVSLAADRVAFEVRLESNDFARYRIVLKDPATSRTEWRSAILNPRSLGAGSFVPVVVPADVLRSQHYSFEVAGVNAAGREETVGSYAFQIDRR
jgi:hypothetical protein